MKKRIAYDAFKNNNNMKCTGLHKKLIFYIEGSLSVKEMTEVEAHLLVCDSCRMFAGEMRKILEVIPSEKISEVSPFFYTRVKARMENRAEIISDATSFSLWEKVLQPAVFSLLLIAGIYAGIRIGTPVKSGNLENNYAESGIFSLINEMEAEPIETFFME